MKKLICSLFAIGLLALASVLSHHPARAQQSIVRSPVLTLQAPASGDSTAMIQGAINRLLKPETDLLHPSGGVIDLGPGTYYITQTLLISNYYCGSIEIKGSGLMAGGIVLISSTAQPVIKVTSKANPAATGNTDPVCPMAFHLHDLFVGATNHTPTNIIECADYARVEIDHNWIGAWDAMTNNNAPLNQVGFSTCTFGFGVSNTALVGVSVQGVSDMTEIHGNSFLGCAAGIYCKADHPRIYNNFFSYCGITNQCATTSPFSLGASIVLQPDMSHNDTYLSGNYFYGCQAAYFIFSTNGAGSYNYSTVKSYDDSFEDVRTNVLLTANVRMKQYDPSFLRLGFNKNAIVSPYPTYAPQNGKIEADRIQILSQKTNILTVTSDAVFANGRAGIVSTGPTATNSWNVYGCGISAANGTYTFLADGGPDGPGVDETTYTNDNTGYYILRDPNQNYLLGGGKIGVLNAANQQQYIWSPSVDDPMIYQWVDTASSHGTAPTGQLQPVYNTPTTTFTGNGSGLTNIWRKQVIYGSATTNGAATAASYFHANLFSRSVPWPPANAADTNACFQQFDYRAGSYLSNLAAGINGQLAGGTGTNISFTILTNVQSTTAATLPGLLAAANTVTLLGGNTYTNVPSKSDFLSPGEGGIIEIKPSAIPIVVTNFWWRVELWYQDH